jgi:hypothetical protein
MKANFCFLLPFLFIFALDTSAQNLSHGDAVYRARNEHAGNLLRITFSNNGRMGSVKGDQSLSYAGEWPIGSGHVQMGNTSGYVMSEMRIISNISTATGETTYTYVTPAVFCQGWDPDLFSHNALGTFLGFEPLPGYLNTTQKEKDPYHSVAMNHQPFTWPPSWPDKLDDPKDPGWGSHWNGYFGKDQMNADQESYYVMDDYQYKKVLQGLTLPLPISSEPQRGGLGLSMSIRGLQWSNPDAEDVLFWLYDVSNFGELNLDRTLLGINVGASSGGVVSGSGSDFADDDSKFYREKALAVNFDHDNIGVGGYTPVPWVGFAFLESPGNPYDGIDNDGDGNDPTKPGGGTGHIITTDDFIKTYPIGGTIALINYDSPNYGRTVTTMPPEGVSFTVKGIKYVKKPNTPLFEIERNGVDDNLNGLIDEADGALTQDSTQFYLYIRSPLNNQDYLAKDYLTNAGMSNLMIDERRDDGIDNDADWDSQIDDVGIDGKPGTADKGEGDAQPTSGIGTNLPGEPNIDKTDVDESDQIGLTSFKFYIYSSLLYSNDDQMWQYSRPGYFDNSTTTVGDYDYVFSSGFFPMLKGGRQFFSIALVYGLDETDILRNKDIVQTIYNSNYNFAVAPLKPKVTAVVGDKQVTLYWDDTSEKSFDRYLKQYDFEGYKVYRSTYYTFEDAGAISDGLGYDRYKKPLAIYDKVDSVFGFFPKDFGTGVKFNLGNETGLVHKYVDATVANGMKYYYAVTGFDKGDLDKNIGPTESSIYVNVDQSGNVQYGENVVAVTPQAPSAGYKAAGFEIVPTLEGDGRTKGIVGVSIVDPTLIKDGTEYEIRFLDQTIDRRDNDLNGLVDTLDKNEFMPTVTTGFILWNVTENVLVDTTWLFEYAKQDTVVYQIQNLYNDNDGDPNTFTKVTNGMQIYVSQTDPGVYDDAAQAIYKGILLGGGLDRQTAYDFKFGIFNDLAGFLPGKGYPRQYKIVFSNSIVDTSDRVGLPRVTTSGAPLPPIPLPAVPVNFKVYDAQTGKRAKFGFNDITDASTSVVAQRGFFSAKDRIIFYEKLPKDSTLITYSFLNNDKEDSTFFARNGRFMGNGDTLFLYTDGPFTGNVRYHFKVRGQKIDNSVAALSMSSIHVVPNPYVVSAVWEPRNPYSTGRGPRAIQFVNLPQECTIRIFSVDGTLVRQLEHSSALNSGAETWDLMSKDNMSISYGVYVYHVDAPGVGQHIGKIFLIK